MTVLSPHESSGPAPVFPVETVLGVAFFTGEPRLAVDLALTGGALVLAPSGPGLAHDLMRSATYRDALLRADLNLTDSGFMLLLWKLRTGKSLPRFSGLGFIRLLVENRALKDPGASFWVMPNREEQTRNLTWLQAQGVAVTEADCYVAPHYGAGALVDRELVARIKARRPRVVVLAIGGGVQERLGLALREALTTDGATRGSRPGVVCIGAAIAFLTGGQAGIPPWADRWMLGWLFRICHAPRRFLPRYVQALKLAYFILRYRDKLPRLRNML